MRAPINNYSISTHHGEASSGSFFGRHLGTDFAGPEDQDVYAPISGTIVQAYLSPTIGNVYEIREDGTNKIGRLAHLKTRPLGVGAHVNEGDVIAKSGGRRGASYSGSTSTGPHVHFDYRAAGTVWNADFTNYQDPEKIIASSTDSKVLPPVGSWIHLLPQDVRTTFRVGTPNEAGKIRVTDDTFKYLVRGYDTKYPGRIIINSASAGGDGVGLALYYLNGQRIPGWKKL